MSSPAHSDLSQNDAEMLEEQRQQMQRRHEEEQQSLLRLQEAAEACCAERAAQKARREVEAKAKEEAERQRVVEEEERKKRTVEYLQRLWDEVLEEEAALLKGAEGSQIAGSKHKEVAAGDEENQQPSKKAREKVPQLRWGVLTPVRGVCAPGRTAWYTSQGEYFVIILIFYFFI